MLITEFFSQTQTELKILKILAKKKEHGLA